jgi:ribosomal protein S18 acetylase RimI-like enzyme
MATKITDMTTIRTELESPATADAVFDDVCQLFASVFGVPPLSRPRKVLDSQRTSLRSLMTEATFGMVTAWDDETLVGFAYGYGLKSGSHWWDGLLTPVAEEMTREWDGRTFVIIDMGVALQWQRHGIGMQLLGTLLASRQEDRASLSVVPDNEAAHCFYRHAGWQYVGRVKGATHHTASSFDIYALALR